MFAQLTNSIFERKYMKKADLFKTSIQGQKLKFGQQRKRTKEYDYISRNTSNSRNSLLFSLALPVSSSKSSTGKFLRIGSGSFLGGVRIVLLAIIDSCCLASSINE